MGSTAMSLVAMEATANWELLGYYYKAHEASFGVL